MCWEYYGKENTIFHISLGDEKQKRIYFPGGNVVYAMWQAWLPAAVGYVKNSFSFPICLEVFTEPVSTACGHNFCRACIMGYWNNSNLCKETFTRRQELITNTTIQEVSEHFKGMWERSMDESAAQCGNKASDICTWSKLKAAKFCLKCLTSLFFWLAFINRTD